MARSPIYSPWKRKPKSWRKSPMSCRSALWIRNTPILSSNARKICIWSSVWVPWVRASDAESEPSQGWSTAPPLTGFWAGPKKLCVPQPSTPWINHKFKARMKNTWLPSSKDWWICAWTCRCVSDRRLLTSCNSIVDTIMWHPPVIWSCWARSNVSIRSDRRTWINRSSVMRMVWISWERQKSLSRWCRNNWKISSQ